MRRRLPEAEPVRQATLLAKAAGRAVPVALLVVAGVAGCRGGRSDGREVLVMGGSPVRGVEAIREFGCGTCHVIPGIRGASGTVGPPLTFWSRRSYIAGALPNAPENLIRWIMDPHTIEPGTAMPDMGVSEQQARDVAAYLYTLE